jgi:hypothetical protein
MDSTISTLAIFFGKTEGRDKFAKGIQNYCRYQKHYASGESKEMFKGLQDSLVRVSFSFVSMMCPPSSPIHQLLSA